MKLKFLLVLSTVVLSLSACGVSQEEYDAVLKEKVHLQEVCGALEYDKKELQNEVDSLSAKTESLQSRVDSLSSTNESLNNSLGEMMAAESERILSELNDAYIKSWATSSFGDNSICLTDSESHFQCISGNTYTISDQGISNLWSNVLDSVKMLRITSDLSNGLPYEYISVKFLDPSGTYILDVILKKEDDSYVLNALMFNSVRASEIMTSFSKLN